MYDAIALIAGVDETPVPTPSMTVDPELVTPGPLGFAIIAIITVIVILLVLDMMRRIRRGRVRADLRDELQAEQDAAAARAAEEGAVAAGDPQGSGESDHPSTDEPDPR